MSKHSEVARRSPFRSSIRRVWLPIACTLAATGLASSASGETPWLRDVAPEVGLDLEHVDGASGELRFSEMMSTGVALFDADGDGDLDAFMAQGGPPPGSAARAKLGATGLPHDRLFLNRLEKGSLRFEAVDGGFSGTATGYGMAVAVADYDADGDQDLFVANLGRDQLWRNRGDGSFDEVGARAGLEGDGWSTGATFFDADGDGDLDLYVLEYVVYDPSDEITCFDDSSRKNYCGPSAFPPARNRLWRNRGDGTFEDATAAAGLAERPDPSLGVVAEDFDGDGRLDLYVANDGEANRLWLAGDGGVFRDEALLAGVAVNSLGAAEAGMGVAVGDVDASGTFDLLVTHLDGETHTLYLDAGGALFEDRTVAWGLAAASRPWTSFGTGFFDLENDGDLDLFVASGAVKLPTTKLPSEDGSPLGQPNQLYRHEGRRFVELGAEAGASFALRETSRAAAFGDVDNDGDLDILLANNGGPLRLLRNERGQTAPWLGLRLVEPAGASGSTTRDALGARVRVELAGGGVRLRRVATDGSYAAASDPRVLVGLGDAKPTAVEVRWPDGTLERFAPPPVGRYSTLRRGTGTKAPTAGAAPRSDGR